MSSPDDTFVRSQPRRPFSLTSTPDTIHTSRPGTPPQQLLDQPHSPSLAPPSNADDPTSPPSRTRSILNLTSSTLLGIYSGSTLHPDRDDATPWGNGAETPIDSRHSGSLYGQGETPTSPTAGWDERSRSRRAKVVESSAKKQRGRSHTSSRRKGFWGFWVPVGVRSAALGAVGVCYGMLIAQLHDRQGLAPVQVPTIPHGSREYLGFWAVVAIVLGSVMPALDRMWEGHDEEEYEAVNVRSRSRKPESERRGSWAPVWNDAVRSIGAFVGIAFAIRKLPWESTLQLSLTLALANPAIWYLLDRTAPGMLFSAAVAISGTALSLAINPDIIPTPSPHATLRRGLRDGNDGRVGASLATSDQLVAGLFTQESIGAATWIASVLFVSCVCFGNIGRRL